MTALLLNKAILAKSTSQKPSMLPILVIPGFATRNRQTFQFFSRLLRLIRTPIVKYGSCASSFRSRRFIQNVGTKVAVQKRDKTSDLGRPEFIISLSTFTCTQAPYTTNTFCAR